jgi:hypothetical protein
MDVTTEDPMKKPFVYVASPYTKGDQGINVRFQCEVFVRLRDDDKVLPYIPLWTHFQHIVFPRPYSFWIEYDNELIDSLPFAACLRLNVDCPECDYKETRSSGADAELARMQAGGCIGVEQREDESLDQVITRLYNALGV